MSLEKVDKSVGSFASSYAIICSILFYLFGMHFVEFV
jgi:hypothetical protein